jgi:hypothetical protein
MPALYMPQSPSPVVNGLLTAVVSVQKSLLPVATYGNLPLPHTHLWQLATPIGVFHYRNFLISPECMAFYIFASAVGSGPACLPFVPQTANGAQPL